MSTASIVALIALGAVAVVSAVIGSIGVRYARTTSDFLLASRTVGPLGNAGAISGEYLSAASFLGVAGLVLREGADALWFPLAFAAGFLALLLFVAGPLRRSGAYTLPDFAEVRLESRLLRRICTLLVVVLGWLYLMTQLQGAGLALTALTPFPAWPGIAVVGVVVVVTVVAGAMRAVTFVQAFQYWLKLTALAVPATIVLAVFLTDGRTLARPAPPAFPAATTVDVRADVVLEVGAPLMLVAEGTVDAAPVAGPTTWAPGPHTVRAGTRLEFAAGSPVPTAAGAPTTDEGWLTPFSGSREHPLLETYSLLLAGVLGTMGLPHVLVRFYSNPDGRAARRTTVVVLAMVGAVYLLVVLLGALSRLFTPQLLVTGQSDAAVLLVPSAALGPGWLAVLVGALVAAGAAAAFLATSCGIVASLSATLLSDALRGRWRRHGFAVLGAAAVPVALALALPRLDFATVLPLIFTIAASTFCPLLVLGIWWRGLTTFGAVTGVLAGGTFALYGTIRTLVGWTDDGVHGVILEKPAVVSVPLAFGAMILVSRLSRMDVLPDVERRLLQLHAPERLGLRPRKRERRGLTSPAEPPAHPSPAEPPLTRRPSRPLLGRGSSPPRRPTA